MFSNQLNRSSSPNARRLLSMPATGQLLCPADPSPANIPSGEPPPVTRSLSGKKPVDGRLGQTIKAYSTVVHSPPATSSSLPPTRSLRHSPLSAGTESSAGIFPSPVGRPTSNGGTPPSGLYDLHPNRRLASPPTSSSPPAPLSWTTTSMAGSDPAPQPPSAWKKTEFGSIGRKEKKGLRKKKEALIKEAITRSTATIAFSSKSID